MEFKKSTSHHFPYIAARIKSRNEFKKHQESRFLNTLCITHSLSETNRHHDTEYIEVNDLCMGTFLLYW